MSDSVSPPAGGPSDRNDLDSWLSWLEARNPNRIELGLDRVRRIWVGLESRGLRVPRVVTVAGTNGKGSSVALLESILLAEGYRVGAYTSPHLVSFTERMRVQGRDIASQDLVAAFECLFTQPDSETLTYFEWATLAAFIAFARADLCVWVLEVGMGGRLDAVNILDADLALITAIGLDHQAVLGSDRVSIAREKAGILRSGRPAVYMDVDPEPSVAEIGRSIGAELWVSGQQFSMAEGAASWSLQLGQGECVWPRPHLLGAHQIRNAAGVVALLRHPGNPLSVSDESICLGLARATVIGRFERWTFDRRMIILDVAHNEESLVALLNNINKNSGLNFSGRRFAVFSAFADKPVEAMISRAGSFFDAWYVAELESERTASVARLQRALSTVGPVGVINEKGIVRAYNHALADSTIGDQIVIFGSFLAVSAIRPELTRAGAHLV